MDLNGASDPLQELQMSIEVIRSVEVIRTHASTTVRVEPHVIIFQRAPETVSLQIRFQTILPALNWTVWETRWIRKLGNSCEGVIKYEGHATAHATKRGQNVQKASFGPAGVY